MKTLKSNKKVNMDEIGKGMMDKKKRKVVKQQGVAHKTTKKSKSQAKRKTFLKRVLPAKKK